MSSARSAAKQVWALRKTYPENLSARDCLTVSGVVRASTSRAPQLNTTPEGNHITSRHRVGVSSGDRWRRAIRKQANGDNVFPGRCHISDVNRRAVLRRRQHARFCGHPGGFRGYPVRSPTEWIEKPAMKEDNGGGAAVAPGKSRKWPSFGAVAPGWGGVSKKKKCNNGYCRGSLGISAVRLNLQAHKIWRVWRRGAIDDRDCERRESHGVENLTL